MGVTYTLNTETLWGIIISIQLGNVDGISLAIR